ncbi:hypothetical protein V0288_20040 [Pannus brasiliensis CCIBt3594]|uniref:Uncharacterized protein n=1 Tax=Pannus brasiliensis CCIBt3594 TaxID=1427578 RepID=A0AAW9QZI5_9CHRO
MNIQEHARQNLAKERLDNEHLHQNLLARSEEGLGEGQTEEEKARELLTQERQEAENRQESLLNRSIEQIQ